MFRGIAPTERGGYSLREMAQQHGPFQYFNSLLGCTQLPLRGPSARFASLGMTEVRSTVREFRLDQFSHEICDRRMIQAVYYFI